MCRRVHTDCARVCLVIGLGVAVAGGAVQAAGGDDLIAYCLQPASGLHQIYTISPDGTGNARVLVAGVGLNHVDWSPDGLKLAAVGYVSQATWSIYTFDVDGTDLTRRTN